MAYKVYFCENMPKKTRIPLRNMKYNYDELSMPELKFWKLRGKTNRVT